MAFHIARSPTEYGHELAEAIVQVKSTLKLCSQCLAFTPKDPCVICSDTRRDQATICVVEKPADMNAIEQAGAFKGVYHILHGVLSPLDGIEPGDLKVQELINRLRRQPVSEVIIATNPTVEGEATATYIAQEIKQLGVRLTRIASGIPLGGEVEYTSAPTLALALKSRREL